MNMQSKKYYLIPGSILSILFAMIGILMTATPVSAQDSYEITLYFTVDGHGPEAGLEAYIPLGDDRQDIALLSEENAGGHLRQTTNQYGRQLRWQPASLQGARNLRYTFQFTGAAAIYQIPTSLTITANQQNGMDSYTAATTALPAGNSFIRRQAKELRAGRRQLSTVVQAFFQYASHLPGRPGPAFANLFYNRSDWKNYLFLSLCRAEGIPARIVNGVELGVQNDYQIRQWAELFIDGDWVPFDASRQYFASIPENYMVSYRGEQPALSHSAGLNVQATMEVKAAHRLIGAVIR